MTVHPRNVVLVCVLAILVGAQLFLARPVTRAEPGGPMVAPFDADRVARIEIEGPAREVGGEIAGGPIVIERDTTGGVEGENGWRVATRYGFPAYEYAVDELLRSVANLDRGDRVGEEASAHALFGVGAGGTRISVQDGAGRTLAALVQGAPGGLANGSYVRLAAEDDVYRAPGFAPVGTRSGAWLDTRLVAFDPTAVREMTISHEDGRTFLDLERDARGWRDRTADDAGPGGQPTYASLVKAERVLHTASTLVFADVVASEVTPAMGFGNPPRTLIELVLVDETELAVWIGLPIDGGEAGEPGSLEGGAYYATNPDWPARWTVALPSATAELLFAAIEQLAR